MIRSMTGYGKGEVEYNGRRFIVEIKSVNHRYCDINMRLPRRYNMLEGELKKIIQGRISRGKLDFALTVEGMEAAPVALEVNLTVANAYYNALCKLKEKLGVVGDITIKDISSLPEIITFREEEPDIERERSFIEAALETGLDALDEMKRAEGDTLAAEIFSRLEKTSKDIDDIEGRAPDVIAFYKKRLMERVEGMGYGLDQGRLAQEVAFFADRSDISEELVRLRSHLEQFKGIAKAPEPSGRKLDFLIQEINREINTIGSKGNDAIISQKVIDMKAELEKVREQVQNIE